MFLMGPAMCTFTTRPPLKHAPPIGLVAPNISERSHGLEAKR